MGNLTSVDQCGVLRRQILNGDLRKRLGKVSSADSEENDACVFPGLSLHRNRKHARTSPFSSEKILVWYGDSADSGRQISLHRSEPIVEFAVEPREITSESSGRENSAYLEF